MSGGLIAFLATMAGVALWAVMTYNRFVASRNRFLNAFAQIDVQLKRRYDLIPNLVNATRGYLRHERETLEAVIQARQRAMSAERQARSFPGDAGALAALGAAETALGGQLTRLFALAEAYPELKADSAVASLIEELVSTENRISFARQAYNDQVATYNIEIESFPAALVARASGFDVAALLQATSHEGERHAVAVAL
ncbi:MAG: LemA family protein [Burkholderiaceae bacterium]